MSRGSELLKNTGILLMARISTQAVNFLLIPLYTRVLNTSEYGEIDLYVSLAMIILPIMTLQIEMGVFRFFITSKEEDDKKFIVTSAIALLAITFGVVSIIYLIANFFLNIKHCGLLYLYYLIQAICAFFLQFCRAQGMTKEYGFATFINSSFAAFLNVILITIFSYKAEAILISTCTANLLSSLYLSKVTNVKQYIGSSKYINRRKQIKLLNYSVPLVFNQVSSWVVNYSDRTIILAVWGIGMNGVYSLANKFPSVVLVFFSVYNVVWTENVIRSIEEKDNYRYINSVFKISYRIYFALSTIVINLLPFVFSFFVGTDYYEAYYHIPILMLAFFYSGIAANVGSLYVALEKTKEVGITTMLSGIVNIIIHLSLLHFAGLYAASISTLISFFALYIFRVWRIKKYYSLNINLSEYIIQIGIFIISSFGFYSKNIIVIFVGTILNITYFVYYIIPQIINRDLDT